MKHLVRTGLAGLVIAAVAAPVATAANITVRAEGASKTIVRQLTVPTGGDDVTKDGKTCDGDSAAGALERATSGNWDGTAFSFGLSVDRIRAESLPFESGKFWGFDVNNSMAQVGVCDVKPQGGDEILFYAACAGATENCFTGNPLDVVAPGRVIAGQPFTVRVDQYDDAKDPAPKTAAGGATISGGGKTVKTAASGKAQLTFDDPGLVTLVATKGSQVRAESTLRVCEQDKPCGGNTASDDTKAPVSKVRGIDQGERFKRAKAPRRVKGNVAEKGGLKKVLLSLRRRSAGACRAFNFDRGRFKRVKCKRHPSFSVGTSKKIDYLLPARLKPGRYRLTVQGIDKAGNREKLERGRNKVGFRVRKK